ncbi:MAG: 50S ribosomal protein L4 [Bacteroidetes bacterium]|nr:50S ribosomal protein L4 [Bacteroidota bacterium]
MKVDILNTKGEKTGRQADLSDDIFGIKPNDHVIYLDVKRYLNAQRQGTHKSKQRNEISGSTRKLVKQKGTGGARKGSIKNPLYKGGGRIFGPMPRDYDIKLNKKVRVLARKSALAYKVQDNAIFIIENFNYETPKTKTYLELLKALNIDTKKSLLLTGDRADNVTKSARNIPNASVASATDINTYSVMNANAIVMMESAIEPLTTVLSNN